MKRIKELTWEQVLFLIEHCTNWVEYTHKCDETCPLFYECLYYYTKDDRRLWENEETKKEEK